MGELFGSDEIDEVIRDGMILELVERLLLIRTN